MELCNEASSYIDAWKNKEVFLEQLNLNRKELSKYPPHWREFVNILLELKTKSILDVGCGVGAMSEVCLKELPDIKYTGMDYSNDAIDIAKKEWPKHNWLVKDYKELTKEVVKEFDTIHAGAILDILPNGDEALDFLLGLQIENVIIGRAKITNKSSHYTTYRAYDKITTYAYYHNINTVKKLAENCGYALSFLGTQNQCNLIFQKIQ